MERHTALTTLEIKFLQGFWLTRKEIMMLTGYCADVTHLMRGLRERGIPVECVKGKPAHKTKWGIKPADLAKHRKNPYAFRSENIERVRFNRKNNAIKNLRRIVFEYGDNLILETIKEK